MKTYSGKRKYIQSRNLFSKKVWPFLAGMSSAAIMLLAFFIPSLQDQWDRHQSRKIINQYESLGNDFYKEGRYDMAEQAYQKAYDLSDSRRLDIEMKRLDAKINRVNMSSQWGDSIPEDLEEIDFQYLLHLQKKRDRVATWNSYGIYLASSKRFKESEKAFTEAIAIDSTDATAYVNLGNLYDQYGKKEKAENSYLRALALEKNNARGHYNLGLLYLEQGKLDKAQQALEEAIRSDSTDTDALKEYEELLERIQNEKQ